MVRENARDVRVKLTGKDSESDLPQLRKIFAALVCLTNPVIGILWGVFLVLMASTRAVVRRAWWFFAAAAVALLISVFGLHSLSPYARPYVETARAFGGELADHGGLIHAEDADPWGRIGALWSERGVELLTGQLWLAVPVALLLASVGAAKRGRYREHWRDEAEEASEAWKSAPKLQRKAAKIDAAAPPRSTRAKRGGSRFSELAMPLGVDTSGERVAITGEHLMSHVVVTGPSGYGKTNTLARFLRGWCVQWSANAMPAVLLDFKGDPELLAAARAFAAQSGRRCHVVSLTSRELAYAPLRHGSSEEVASRLVDVLENMKGGAFSDAHYRTLGQRILICAMTVLDALIEEGVTREHGGRWQRELDHIAALMRISALEDAAKQVRSEKARAAVARLVDELDEDRSTVVQGVTGMRNRVALLGETGAADLISNDAGSLDLEAAMRVGDLVVFSLASAVNHAAARDIGNLALADLSAMFGRFTDTRWARSTGKRVAVIVDEFSALGGGLMLDMFARARGAGGVVVLSTQTTADLDAVSPDFAQSVKTNSNLWLLHKQVGDDATAAAEAIGTRDAWQETKQVVEDRDLMGTTTAGSGAGTVRRVKTFKVHPDELKDLATGQLIMWSGTPAELRRVVVAQVAELTDPVPQDESPRSDDLDDAPTQNVVSEIEPATEDVVSPAPATQQEPAGTAPQQQRNANPFVSAAPAERPQRLDDEHQEPAPQLDDDWGGWEDD